MSFNIADNGKKRVVIVGGGFGGLRLARNLRKSDYQVVLIDKNNYHQFPPLIYQIATAGLTPGDISFPYRKIFEDRSDYFYRMAELRAVYADKNYIQTSIGKLCYDYLVLACGTKTNFFHNSNIEASAVPMKTISEAMGLRNTILSNFERAITCSDEKERQELLNVVSVGGGPSGVEIAGALAEMRKYVVPKDYPDMDISLMNIILVQGAKRLLPGMSEKASGLSLKFLEKMGVKVRLGTRVTDYADHAAVLNSGESIPTRNLIWVGGVICPDIPGIGKGAIGRGNRILVDEHCRVDGTDNIFAIGDIALMHGDPSYPEGHPQMAQPAIQQGDLVARNLRALAKGGKEVPFRYRDLGSMATIGRNKAVADIAGMHFGGFFAWLIWMFVHLMSILGVKNKFSVFFDWVWSYFTYDRSNRMILKSAATKEMKDLEQRIRESHWGDLKSAPESADGKESREG